MTPGEVERQKKVVLGLRVGCGVFFGVCRPGTAGRFLRGFLTDTESHILRTIESGFCSETSFTRLIQSYWHHF